MMSVTLAIAALCTGAPNIDACLKYYDRCYSQKMVTVVTTPDVVLRECIKEKP